VASATSLYQAVPPAPGRPSGPVETNAHTVVPSEPPGPAGGAPPPSGPSGFSALFPILLFVPLLILLFWSSRSQQKKQTAALAGLKKGDQVVLQSGLIGELVQIGERTMKVEIAPGVAVEVLKSGVVGKDGGNAAGAPATTKK
jgi:preprotein translocase subunit YajC